jgi:3-deoxy-D-manno-octulosonate 8-phosphate phosphatase (KDO 8-P phosphatase)
LKLKAYSIKLYYEWILNMGQINEIDVSKIKLLVMDVDGVLTDGTVIINSDGSEGKNFSIVDGHGIKLWHRVGFQTAIISGRPSGATTVRAEQLSIGHVVQGAKKKLPAFDSLLEELKLDYSEVAFVGDDLLDLPLVRRAAFGVAVANAVDELKEVADYTTTKNGGNGAVREVIEYILKRNGKWQDLMQRYLV